MPYSYAQYMSLSEVQLVGVWRYPPGTTLNLQKALQGLAARLHGSILGSQATNFVGYEALKATLQAGDGTYFTVAVVHAKTDMYLIALGEPSASQSDFDVFASTVTLSPHT